jgi:hypothetical protein
MNSFFYKFWCWFWKCFLCFAKNAWEQNVLEMLPVTQKGMRNEEVYMCFPISKRRCSKVNERPLTPGNCTQLRKDTESST